MRSSNSDRIQVKVRNFSTDFGSRGEVMEISQECWSSAWCSCSLNLCRAGAVVWRLSPSHHDSGGTTLFDRWGNFRTAVCSQGTGSVCADWNCVADGIGDQKLDSAGGLCRDESAGRKIGASGSL